MAFFLFACLCVFGFFCLLSIICRHTLYCYIVDVLNSIFDDLCTICKGYIFFLNMYDRQEFSFSRLYRHILSLTEI